MKQFNKYLCEVENSVIEIDNEEYQSLIEFAESNNLFLFLKEYKKFPGSDLITNFINNILEPYNGRIFDEWSKYVSFIFPKRGKFIFFDMTIDEELLDIQNALNILSQTQYNISETLMLDIEKNGKK